MKSFTPSTTGTLRFSPEPDDLVLHRHEVEALRVELRRVMGRINFRTRRGWMFVGLLVLTLASVVTMAVFLLSPNDWLSNQRSRFTQMTGLLVLLAVAVPLAAYLARRYDRQRQRVRIAESRRIEILQRLAQLDEAGGRRRRRRRKRRSWAWRITHPSPFSRPPVESLSTDDLEETADALGNQVLEERAMRALAYAHAGITGGVTVIVAFVVTLSGPEYLSGLLGAGQWGGAAGPDPLVFWATLTLSLVILGGLGSHRVTVLLRHARAYHDRLAAVERTLWDVRVLLRERREKV